MAPFSKPETVLKQAEGLVSVGQNHAALQSLTDIFNSKRLRSTPLAALEPIMLRFVELCVDMRKGRTAKEGLMQYKNIAQNTSVGSIEIVIKRFVQLADEKVQEAQQKAEQVLVSFEDVDDLEAIETPESILLGAVSVDQNKDRTDRALVTPWLKFLWESYRTALETLKNNDRLELIYQQIAQQAFKFCLQHKRKVEFRRLCETLRLHLSNVAKYAHQPHSINLSDPETLQRHLDTRFAQLSAAVELELWQEAFRSVEDVHNLLTMAKKAPRPGMMAGYYEKLTKIFLMSGNGLYHAAAWSRYYSIVRTNPSANVARFPEDEKMSRLAGVVLLSALAVPLANDELDTAQPNKVSRLTSLLGLAKVPTRSALLASALASTTLNNIPLLKVVPKQVKAFYDLLETSFDPLYLCVKAAPILQDLETIFDGIYKAYVPRLRNVILSRLFAQLSQVYDNITLVKLRTLVKPLSPEEEDEVTSAKLESFVMTAARSGDLSIRVDHATGLLSFVEDMSSSPVASTSSTLLQASEFAVARTRLSTIASALRKSIAILHPLPTPEHDFAALAAAAETERKALTLRRAIVARRRELQAELAARKEKEEAGRRAEASKREKEEEARRALEEARRREIERHRRERENIKNEEVRKLAKSLQDRGNLKVDLNAVEQLDSESLMRLQVEQLEKEKREQSERVRIIAKRQDHLERALRKAERPLLEKDYEQQQQVDRAAHQATVEAKLQIAREAHEANLAKKERLARIVPDYRKFRQDLAGKRGEEYARKKEEAAMKIEEEKAERRKAVAAAREEKRRLRAEEETKIQEAIAEEARKRAEREAEERRKLEEEAAKIQAELDAKREQEEKIAAARAKRDAERKEAQEAAARQRQREEEAERRALERRQGKQLAETKAPVTPARTNPIPTDGDRWRRGSPAPPVRDSNTPPPLFKGAGRGGPTWRDRMKAKEGSDGAARASTPPDSPKPADKFEDKPAAAEDGFQTVPKKQVWQARRGRGI